MKRYKIDYTRYDGDTWTHESATEVVEAEDEASARFEIESRSCPWADYIVDSAREIEGEGK